MIGYEVTNRERKDTARLALEDGLASLEPDLARIAPVSIAILRY